jgi:ABC-type bacteriocin/lantibiotic exporter with double-glycine peptidase domain
VEEVIKFLPDKITPVFIKMQLPLETNPKNDCGVLCLQMILSNDTQIDKKELSLGKMRERIDKTFKEGVNPGSICKILKEEGYDVKYFTTIDGESISENDPKTSFEKWDPRVIGIVNNSEKHGIVVNLEKLQASAKWLTKEENKEIISKKNLSIKEISDFLRENKRIITLVMNGAHYVVVTGVDNEKIYYNDPATNEKPTMKSLTHNEFLKYWAEREDMRDAIVAGTS